MTDGLVTHAVRGDQESFRKLTDPYRRELQLHCYRILGSMQDAEDMLQETMLAAWRDGIASSAGRRFAAGAGRERHRLLRLLVQAGVIAPRTCFRSLKHSFSSFVILGR
jgi:hypothetical protein